MGGGRISGKGTLHGHRSPAELPGPTPKQAASRVTLLFRTAPGEEVFEKRGFGIWNMLLTSSYEDCVSGSLRRNSITFL